jgi:hypothetical protein
MSGPTTAASSIACGSRWRRCQIEFRPDRCGFIITAMSSAQQVEIQIDKTSTKIDRRLPAAIEHFLSLGLSVVEMRGDMVRHHPPLVGPNAN